MASPYKRYLPRSLFGRALTILLAPIVLLQLVVAGLFVQRHYAGVTEQMAGAVGLELLYAVEQVERAEDVEAARAQLEALARPLGLTLALDPGAAVTPDRRAALYDVSGDALADTLERVVGRPMSVDLVSHEGAADVRVATELGALRALIPRKRTIASNPHILLVWMVATAVLLAVVAVLFLRNQVRPIRQLAAAAEAFGKGRAEPFRPAGAEEVRRAGAAFLDMRRRIERAIEQRSNMLYGVSHDLRTPLTRMKLALAMAEEGPETDELRRDVDEMDRMLDAFLDYARGGKGEPAETVLASALLEAAASDARRAGAEVATEVEPGAETAEAKLREGEVRRALANLIGNAARYGTRCVATLRAGRGWLEFVVEDDGPGIPEEARERAMRPFARLDAARNQDRGGGVGLGLAIALDIARGHGGTLELEDSARLGGLKAVLRLPR
jgi:two-component system osmolarity sensor histidine kinase EnvZ